MTRIRFTLLACTLAISSLPALAKKAAHPIHKDVDVVEINDADREMQKAFTRARATFKNFMQTVGHNNPRFANVAVKVAIRQGKKTDYLWVTPFSPQEDGWYLGTLSDMPTKVSNVKPEDLIKFKATAIVDWMYVDKETNVMHGNYTTCVLMKNAPEEERAQMKRVYGLDCLR